MVGLMVEAIARGPEVLDWMAAEAGAYDDWEGFAADVYAAFDMDPEAALFGYVAEEAKRLMGVAPPLRARKGRWER